jgi:hypothetical protein
MSCLHTLREARSIVRWMLVWFALSIGVAVASPVVQPQAMTLICSTSGSVKFVAASAADASDQDAAKLAQPHGMECVFCLPAGALPVDASATVPPGPQLATQPEAALAALHVRPRDPASARGPPALR